MLRSTCEEVRPGSLAIGWHVTLRLADSRPIATTPGARRVLARVVLERGEEAALLAFGAADDHVHAELACTREQAGRFALYVETALRWRLRLRAVFDPARIRPIADQRHAYNTFRYAHGQDAHHQLELDTFREATSLPDLLGLRVLPTNLHARVREHLPRIRADELAAPFARALQPRELDLELLADSAAAALALDDIRCNVPDAVRARRAAVQLASTASTEDLMDCLGLARRTVQGLRHGPPDEPLLRAVTLQNRLRASARPPPRKKSEDETQGEDFSRDDG